MSGSNEVPYVISSRTQIQPATNYRLCNNGGSQTLCQSPVAASAGNGGGTANAGDDNGGAQE